MDVISHWTHLCEYLNLKTLISKFGLLTALTVRYYAFPRDLRSTCAAERVSIAVTLLPVFERCSLRISIGEPAILTEVFRGFPQSFDATARTEPQYDHNQFLSYHFNSSVVRRIVTLLKMEAPNHCETLLSMHVGLLRFLQSSICSFIHGLVFLREFIVAEPVKPVRSDTFFRNVGLSSNYAVLQPSTFHSHGCGILRCNMRYSHSHYHPVVHFLNY